MLDSITILIIKKIIINETKNCNGGTMEILGNRKIMKITILLIINHNLIIWYKIVHKNNKKNQMKINPNNYNQNQQFKDISVSEVNPYLLYLHPLPIINHN
jgi:hypothetical protein